MKNLSKFKSIAILGTCFFLFTSEEACQDTRQNKDLYGPEDEIAQGWESAYNTTNLCDNFKFKFSDFDVEYGNENIPKWVLNPIKKYNKGGFNLNNKKYLFDNLSLVSNKNSFYLIYSIKKYNNIGDSGFSYSEPNEIDEDYLSNIEIINPEYQFQENRYLIFTCSGEEISDNSEIGIKNISDIIGEGYTNIFKIY